MSNIAAIIVTYNRKEMLCACIDRILHGTVVPDILVIDNHSIDGTAEALWSHFSTEQIRYFDTGENLGGAGGFNYGMKRALQDGYEYLWVMDDDCFPEDDALEKFLEADKILKGEYGWLSSVALWTDGNECRMNRQKLKKSFYEYIPYMRYGLVQAEQATFVSLFLKSKTIERVGLPIKEFFIWGDDIEFTRRIAVREKIPSFVVGQSCVVHAMEVNSGSSISLDSVERLSRYNYAFRNENYLYRKEGIKGFGYYLAKCGKNIFCSILQAKDYRLRRCGIITKQMALGLFFNPKVEYME